MSEEEKLPSMENKKEIKRSLAISPVFKLNDKDVYIEIFSNK